MNKLILTLAIISSFYSTAQTIAVSNVEWTPSKVAIDRSLLNFITLLNMDQNKFETQMKEVGNIMDITTDFCVRASEQMDIDWVRNGGDFDTKKHLIYTKCTDRLIVMWYGSEKGSGLREFVSILQPYFIKKEGSDSWYSYKYNDKVYNISLSRTSDDGEKYFESLIIFNPY